MLEQVEKYIQDNNLANKGTPILVACSVGVDSMVLVKLLQLLTFPISIAHCNFQLRDEESDGDESFIRTYAEENNIPLFVKRFETIAYKKNSKISTQMAARELRYEWFEQIRKENNFHSIATAHHLDDQLETILMNFAKGTGVNGLSGMQAKNNFIIRPLLQIPKQSILQFAQDNHLAFREDSSNLTDDYQRNKIRHHITPKLLEINPNLYENVLQFTSIMQDTQTLLALQIDAIRKKCVSIKNGNTIIKINYVKQHPAKKTVLFLLLKDFGFTDIHIEQIFKVKESSKQFFSETHRLIIDRNELIITSIRHEILSHLLMDKIPNNIQFNQYKIQCSVVPIEHLNIKDSKNYAYIALEKLEFPLMLRYLKEGDYFYPFGIGKSKNPLKVGKKKIGKYFRDEKLSLLEKEQTPILFSKERAVWLVGHRIDDRFKVTGTTKEVLKFKIIKG